MAEHDNIAYACLTKLCLDGSADHVSTRWVNRDLSFEDITYASIEAQSNQIANTLRTLGIKPGDVVSIFLPRSPILVNIFFAILKHQALACVLFSTLGEEGLLDRMQNSAPKFVITKKSLLHKILAIRKQFEAPVSILIVDIDEHQPEEVFSLPKLLKNSKPVFDYPHKMDPATPAFLQYTSGSTGKPKGALHVHGAIEDMRQSFVEIMSPMPGDIFWCTADPAWITGLVYGIIAPMVTETFQLQFTGGYNATIWLKLLEQEKVSIWYTAPTALRMLMQENEQIFNEHNLTSLDRIYSVGEPLNPEIYSWGKKVFGKEIYDTWFQSETGSIMIANKPGMLVKPGSMGLPRSGIKIKICDDTMKPLPTGEQGHLCVVPGWKSMFRNYFRREFAYQEKFRGNLYVTGDLARKDEQGYIWYISRSDDVINTGGHLVGPFEVESALLEVEEVGDVAVIGAHDPILHQKIVAFVVLSEGVSWTRNLELKCRMYVSDKVSTTAIPSEFQVVERIPKNQSGKILRRVLKAIYEGEDPGDLSTME